MGSYLYLIGYAAAGTYQTHPQYTLCKASFRHKYDRGSDRAKNSHPRNDQHLHCLRTPKRLPRPQFSLTFASPDFLSMLTFSAAQAAGSFGDDLKVSCGFSPSPMLN